MSSKAIRDLANQFYRLIDKAGTPYWIIRETLYRVTQDGHGWEMETIRSFKSHNDVTAECLSLIKRGEFTVSEPESASEEELLAIDHPSVRHLKREPKINGKNPVEIWIDDERLMIEDISSPTPEPEPEPEPPSMYGSW